MANNIDKNNGEKKEKLSRQAKSWLGLETETKNGILAVFFFTLSIISVLSYVNLAGIFGEYFIKIGNFLFGKGTFLITLTLILGGVSILKSFHKDIYKTTLIGMVLFVFSFLGILAIFYNGAEPVSGGGYIGYGFSYPFVRFLGIYASIIVFVALLVSSIMIILDISIIRLFGFFSLPFKKSKDDLPNTMEDIAADEEKGVIGQIAEIGKKILPRPNFRVQKIDEEINEDSGTEKNIFSKKTGIPDIKISNWKMPPLDLLEEDRGKPSSGDIKAMSAVIQKTLFNFGLEVEMGETNVGPTVTQYTLKPSQGVKLTKITGLSNDLSLALAAHPIRIEAPIPGRSLVGIEVPNRVVSQVRLKNLIEQKDFAHNSTLLTLALGRNVSGGPVFCGLEKMPHMLIAGATGAGKTICLNTVIVSLLYRLPPEQLKMILIDPKRVEFPVYKDIPHLLTPVIVDADKTVNALQWAVGEMERRFDILSAVGSRDIISYNKKNELKPLPYIVLVIDELADLMATFGREVEAAIVRLAQMSRAVGIHLVVCTQRPSVDVITGLIKANITCRIALQVASQIDSRTILDMGGAEKLLGNGDMLYLAGDASKPIRVQGAFISEKETKRVADYIRTIGQPIYQQEVTDHKRDGGSSWGGSSSGDDDIDDDMYEEAKDVVMAAGKASASLLQRRLRIGYARAARLLDVLEEKGVIGPPDGAKPRQVLIKDDSKDWYSQFDHQQEVK
ncbi:MAG: translocase FtsK protein [Parcubacteria group bacterium GW2011_GWF2_39_13b]|nr:MAG: translocase FtsK protein [Parcubacteria group bacterium GW2011_GWF2_39_13b]